MMDYRTLTPEQFKEIMNIVWNHHRFGGLGKENYLWVKGKLSRNIKYVRPQFDMRDGSCFCIGFDETYFDFRDSEETMYERICKWLEGDGDNID